MCEEINHIKYKPKMLEIRKLLLFLFQSFNVRIFTHKYRTKELRAKWLKYYYIHITHLHCSFVNILFLEIENSKKTIL